MRSNTRNLAWEAGADHRVPFVIMWGVQGIETDFGRNISTSSAGAEGLYQFIASTAAEPQWDYPYTNSHDPGVLRRQAYGAARYLAALHGGRTWDAALQLYSGHGYGLADVEAKARSYNGGGLQTEAASVRTAPTSVGVTGSAVVPVHVTTAGDPPGHAQKVYVTGKGLSVHGNHFAGHTQAMRNLRNRHTPIRV